MYAIYPDLTKKYLLEHVSQEEIFYFYTNYHPAHVNCSFSSPLRQDRNPSCSYYRTASGTIVMKDFGTGERYDCYKLVMTLFHLDFYHAIRKIADDFAVNYHGKTKMDVKRPQLPKDRMKNTKATVIQIKSRDWTKKDLQYWQQFGIAHQTLDKFNVIPVNNVFLNGKICYSYYGTDPGYAYRLGPYQYKVYFPERSTYRFLGNTSKVQGYQQLPPTGDHIVITKSMKDVMVFNEFNVAAVAPQAESVVISREFYDHIKSRFEHIYLLYDNDMAGKRGTVKTIQAYPDITPCQIPSVYAKDISDFNRDFGAKYTKSLIYQCYELQL